MHIVVKILGMKPVQDLLGKLTGKLFGSKGAVKNKVTAGLSVAAIVAVIITITRFFAPGLADLLQGHEVTLIGVVALVQALIMYFTADEE